MKTTQCDKFLKASKKCSNQLKVLVLTKLEKI